MLRKRRLVRSAPSAVQRHVIQRREDVESLPFRAVSFGQVQNVRVAGIQPVTETLKRRAKPGAEPDDIDVEVSQLVQQGTGRPKIEMAYAEYRHGMRCLTFSHGSPGSKH